MKVAVVGTGYVGLVTGTCLAERGNDVTCVDIVEDKVRRLQQGKVPIYEPGLEEIFQRNLKEGRLSFTTNLNKGIDGAEAIFLALPTPEAEDGSADLSYILKAAEDIGPLLKQYAVIIDKSTVPVGTTEKVRAHIAKKANVEFDVVSNPEFLREGQAVADFLDPERVVIGTKSADARKVMEELYHSFVQDDARILITDEASAEMIKYAANGFLATKISFINELSRVCEAVGADIEKVREGIGMDSRIGPQFLYAGPGYGGSCFPKDTEALKKTALDEGCELSIIDATIRANERQKHVMPTKVLSYYDQDIKGRTFALWGLAFKDNTDDIRESPALKIIQALTKHGAKVVAFDPQAKANTMKQIGENDLLAFAEDEYSALNNADALVIATNWAEFNNPDFKRIKKLLKEPVIFDGRNLYSLELMTEEGFHYESIGRRVVSAK